MDDRIKKMKGIVAVVVIIQVVIILVLQFVLKQSVMISYLFVGIEAVLAYFIVHSLEYDLHSRTTGIDRLVANEYRGALSYGEVGILTYDEKYTIESMSELFIDRKINRIGKKLLVWLPEVDDLISGKEDSAEVTIDERTYEITRKEDGPVLFFRDITDTINYRNAYTQEQVVIGMIHLDNYEESTQYEDEQEISNINNTVRQPIVDWAKEYGIILRRVKNDRYFVVLNESIFHRLADDRFQILNTVRKASAQLDVPITLSMAFARGSSNLQELDDMVVDLMDVAQTRGGDQVAIRKVGEDVKYFGGSSEALEKRSKVRVRIMSNTIKDLIQKSSNVIICCHKDADFDCVGAAIAMSRIVQSYNTSCCIITKTGGIDEQLKNVMIANKKELEERHKFVTENEAVNQLTKDSLVIMVDHHSVKQTNGPQVLENAKKIAIIDHHRRSADLDVTPILVYVEAGASSTCELVTEFVPYLTNRIDINSLEATIMFTGMLVDTNRFKMRTGTRTFEAASLLRKWNADPIAADDYLKDSYEEFDLKSDLMNKAEKYENGIIISTEENKIVTRTMMSQVADSLLQIKGVEASFVISKTEDGQVAISARSNGKINVQVVMEKMQGGGHRTGAGLQRPAMKIEDLKNELILTLQQYFEEETVDESNTTK